MEKLGIGEIAAQPAALGKIIRIEAKRAGDPINRGKAFYELNRKSSSSIDRRWFTCGPHGKKLCPAFKNVGPV